MMKLGIYQTVKPHQVFEQHGGGTIRHEIYWSLCFLPDNRVGLFGAGKNFFRPYFKNELDMTGEITRRNGNYLEFYILNRNTPHRKLYTEKIKERTLHTSSFYEDKPEEVVKEVFEYVDNPKNEWT